MNDLASEIIRKQFIIIVVLIVALLGTNLAWLVYESQFTSSSTTETIELDSEGEGTNNYIGSTRFEKHRVYFNAFA